MTDMHTLAFRRLGKPDEDGLIRLEVRAQNEIISAVGEGLTSTKNIVFFADALNLFPKQLPDSASFSAVGCGRDVAIGLKTLDSSGHVGIEVLIQEDDRTQGNSATLWLKTRPSALMDLARQLRKVADLSSEFAELPT
jgi:hypothetical protein